MAKKLFSLLISLLSLFVLQNVYAATLSLSPSSGSYTVGNTFTVSIILDTEAQETSGVDIHYLNYNPSLLRVRDANGSQPGVQISPGSLYPNTPVNLVDTINGRIDFSQTTAGGTTYKGKGTLATITFEVLSSGVASVTFNFTPGSTIDTNVAADGTDVLSSVTNGTYTLSFGGGGTGGGGTGGGGTGGGDTTPPGEVSNLLAISGDREVTLFWTNPADSDFEGVLIMRKEDGFSSRVTDGFQVYKGKETTFKDTGLTNGVTYYYTLFTFDKIPNYSNGMRIKGFPNIISPTTTGTPPSTSTQGTQALHWWLSQLFSIFGIKPPVVQPPSTSPQGTQALPWWLSQLFSILGIKPPVVQPPPVTPQFPQITGIPKGYKFIRNLRFRMSGVDVKYLQIFLKAQGPAVCPYKFVPSYYFGPVTLSCVKKFQAKYKIPVTGFVGPKTRAKINQLLP